MGCDRVNVTSGRVTSGGADGWWYERFMTCSSCEVGVDHCHGTLVEHGSGFIECTDMACLSFAVERHSLVIDCEAVEGGCGCTAHLQVDSSVIEAEIPHDRLLRAS